MANLTTGFTSFTRPTSLNQNLTTQNLSVGGNSTVTGSVTGAGNTLNGFRRAVDNTLLTGAGGTTTTLTAAQSGTLFLINGTGNNVINLPALSTANVGISYEFLLTTAVGGGTTTTIVLPAGGTFLGLISLIGGVAANPASDVAGTTLTLVNATLVNARVSITCVTDDGTNSQWRATTVSSPVATIA